jgi:hypothetical protein
MKAYGGVDVYIHIYVTSALAGGEWSASHPCCFTPGERTPPTHCIRGWVDPRAGLDDLEKRKLLTLLGLELQPLGLPACSQSLYYLRFSGSKCVVKPDYNGIQRVLNIFHFETGFHVTQVFAFR